VRLRIISTNCARSRFCRRGLCRAPVRGWYGCGFLFVRGIDFERRIELRTAVEQAVVQRFGGPLSAGPFFPVPPIRRVSPLKSAVLDVQAH